MNLASFADLIVILRTDPRLKDACKRVGISQNELYLAMEKDPKLRDAINKAQQAGMTTLEDEAIRRAVFGWDEPVFHKGVAVGSIRKFSDRLLTFLLEGNMPEKYRATATKLSPEAQAVQEEASVDLAHRLAAIVNAARQRRDAPECLVCGGHHGEGEPCK